MKQEGPGHGPGLQPEPGEAGRWAGDGAGGLPFRGRENACDNAQALSPQHNRHLKTWGSGHWVTGRGQCLLWGIHSFSSTLMQDLHERYIWRHHFSAWSPSLALCIAVSELLSSSPGPGPCTSRVNPHFLSLHCTHQSYTPPMPRKMMLSDFRFCVCLSFNQESSASFFESLFILQDSASMSPLPGSLPGFTWSKP